MPTLADVLRKHGPTYLARHGPAILPSHRRAIRDITACRTGELGAELACCPRCGARHLLMHSCRNRACPTCGGETTARWLARQREALLPVPYFHVVLTVPAELRDLIRQNQRSLLSALVKAAFASLSALCADPKILGAAQIAALAVLHTWSRTLTFHPHVHLLVAGGGLAPDGVTWLPTSKRGRRDFLVPARALANAFRGRFVARIRRALPGVEIAKAVFHKPWVVHVKRTLPGCTDRLLRYLGRYVHRTALTDKRIVACAKDAVAFSYCDSRDGNHKRMSLDPDEFIRRFLQHTPPRGFHRVRSYGLLHARSLATLHRLQLMLMTKWSETSSVALPGPELPPKALRRLRCPSCGDGALLIFGRLSAAECFALKLARGPPFTSSVTVSSREGVPF